MNETKAFRITLGVLHKLSKLVSAQYLGCTLLEEQIWQRIDQFRLSCILNSLYNHLHPRTITEAYKS